MCVGEAACLSRGSGNETRLNNDPALVPLAQQMARSEPRPPSSLSQVVDHEVPVEQLVVKVRREGGDDRIGRLAREGTMLFHGQGAATS